MAKCSLLRFLLQVLFLSHKSFLPSTTVPITNAWVDQFGSSNLVSLGVGYSPTLRQTTYGSASGHLLPVPYRWYRYIGLQYNVQFLTGPSILQVRCSLYGQNVVRTANECTYLRLYRYAMSLRTRCNFYDFFSWETDVQYVPVCSKYYFFS